MQKGLGERCSNRAWANMSILISAIQREDALKCKNSPLPVFNDTVYLARVYNGVQSDNMIQDLWRPLRPLVLVECVDYKGEFIKTIEDYLNNIVNAKSWASNAHDSSFEYFYGRVYCIELYSSILNRWICISGDLINKLYHFSNY
jgi:hypothetical protein